MAQGEGLGGLFGQQSTAIQFIIWAVLSQIAGAILQPITVEIQKNMFQGLPSVPLSPADAADAAERNILDLATAAAYAQQGGVGGDVFNILYELTGEPPGLIDMLRLWRRGDLDQGTLETMIAYSRVRTEWTSYVEKLAYDVLPAADVVEGYIKGQIDHDTAQSMFAAAGGMADQFDLAASLAGDAIGIEQAANLLNHGLIDQAMFDAIIAYSRVNPQFEGVAALAVHKWLSVYEIGEALKAGTVDVTTATEWMIQDGYDPDQAAAFTTSQGAGTTVKPKELTTSMILDTYEAGLMTEAQALEQLGVAGYSETEALLYIQSYDARKILTLLNQGVTSISKAYKVGRLTASDASNALDGIGIDPTLRDYYLKLWNVEVETEFKSLTMAQIGDFAKDGIVSYEWAIGQWVAMGYSSVDALLLSYYYGNALPEGGTGL